MKTLSLFALASLTASVASAEETRQLDAHEHGVGQLDIAVDGAQIAMELHAPGADIVGFEYAATRAEDRAKVDAAVATLARPLDLFVLPTQAGCSVVQASAALESEEAHEDHGDAHEHGHGHKHGNKHGHEDHAEEGHEGHDDHAEEGHEGHEDQAEKGHDDHDHDKHDHAQHAEEGHSDEDHAQHVNEASHTEFHAEYLLNCADTAAVSVITFAYFETFPNALKLEVQLITDKGATAFEVERDAPTLDLRGMF